MDSRLPDPRAYASRKRTYRIAVFARCHIRWWCCSSRRLAGCRISVSTAAFAPTSVCIRKSLPQWQCHLPWSDHTYSTTTLSPRILRRMCFMSYASSGSSWRRLILARGSIKQPIIWFCRPNKSIQGPFVEWLCLTKRMQEMYLQSSMYTKNANQ